MAQYRATADTLRQGRAEGVTAQRVQALCGVTRLTLGRWRRYFRDHFPQTAPWRALVGRLWPPVRRDGLIADLLGRFVRARGDPAAGLVACLGVCVGDGR